MQKKSLENSRNKLSKLGDCFQVAGKMALDNQEITLCQAKVSGQGKLKGRRIWHSWCEIGDMVFDYSNGNKIVIRKERYYALAKIKEKDVRKYTNDQARRLMLKHKRFGLYPEGDKNRTNRKKTR